LATGHFENALEADIHFQRGNAFAALGKTDMARDAWKLAAESLDSKDPRITEAPRNGQKSHGIPLILTAFFLLQACAVLSSR
jgi:hypothetical protein